MVSTVLYGSQFVIDGQQLNGGLDSSGIEWTLTNESGWFQSPPIKQSRADRPTSRGGSVGNEYKGARVIALGGEMTAPSVSALRQAERLLFGLCSAPDQLYPLTVTEEDGLVLTANVKLDGPILTAPKSWQTAIWTMQLYAPDSRKFAVSTTNTTPLASSGGGGVQWRGAAGTTGVQWQGPTPGTTGTRWGPLGSSGTITLDNRAGTAPADVVATFTPVSEDLPSPSIVNALTGETVTYGPTLHVGDILVVNCATGSVLVNGANQRPNLTRADFFEVPKGTQLPVRFQASGSAPTALMTVSISPAYY
jgi:hypothetical protein